MIFQDVSFLGYVIPITLTVLLIVIDLILAVIFYRKMGLSFIKCFSNFLWATFVGWELALYYLIGGLLCCLTIILIPIGLQFFKFARLALWPFGYSPRFTNITGFKMFVNILWIIIGGWENALACFISGALMCCTIILIPCGLQMFKFARLMFMPLGTTIEKD